MDCKLFIKRLKNLVVVVIALTMTAMPAIAVEDVYLVARQFSKTLSDGATIVMWGFAPADAGFTNVGTPTVPGPMITVPVGETTLSIHLRNELPVNPDPIPISIVIPGQPTSLTPVKFTDSQGRQRARSFTTETVPGVDQVYTWNNLKQGTYLYHSGTHPAVQVQMGLYGGAKVDAAIGEAYTSNPNVDAHYDKDIVLLYSEIDPALHAAVIGGTYGTPAYPSAFDYKPEYFLINGDTYPLTSPIKPDGSVPILNTNDNILIRFLNAGLKSHIPVLPEGNLSIIAEDGNLYPYAKERYSFLLAAGKTLDVLWKPVTEGTYPVFDRCLHLTDNGSPGGGMLTNLAVADISGAPVATDNNYSVVEDNNLYVSPGVLADDTGTNLTCILVSDVSNGSLILDPNGSFTYEPNPNFSGTDIFTYKANDGATDSNKAIVKITVTPVNDAPVAVNDSASTVEGVAIILDVLTNDMDVDQDQLVVTNIVHDGINASVTINADNTLIYSPNTGYTGPDSLTYTANDGLLDSNIATVTLTVNIRVNSNPIAEDDYASTTRNTPVTIDLVTNDHDPDGTIDPDTIAIVTLPTRGGTVAIVTGGVIFTPKKNFRGTDVFTYTVNDNEAATSNIATVRVNVVR